MIHRVMFDVYGFNDKHLILGALICFKYATEKNEEDEKAAEEKVAASTLKEKNLASKEAVLVGTKEDSDTISFSQAAAESTLTLLMKASLQLVSGFPALAEMFEEPIRKMFDELRKRKKENKQSYD
jgi:hypothetical protein